MIEILRDLPDIKNRNAVIAEPYECGAGTYYILVKKWEEDEYETYLDELNNAGFQLYVKESITLNGSVKIALLKKDTRLLTATYYPTMTIARITVSEVKFDKEWNSEELFHDVPSPESIGLCATEAVEYGAGNYVLTVHDAKREHYNKYLKLLEKAEYQEYVNNGEGLASAVFSSIYIKKSKVLTVTFVKKLERLYISACYDLPLSKHLFCQSKNVGRGIEEKKTKLHMPELWWFGNSFIIQLKNGHFIISDGGFPDELNYLLDYLDELVDEGEKPIVEAWFITHAHSDHCAVLRRFVTEPELVERIFVEGLYFNQPGDNVIALDPGVRDDVAFTNMAAKALFTTKGEHPEIYRPQTGQRYYFDDITVDIVFAQEQLAFHECSGDVNDSSTWCMFNIEGQKMLLGGDGDKGAIQFIMGTYEQEYMTLELFSLLHHGWNVWDHFTDFCNVKSVLNTSDSKYPPRRIPAINHMKASVEEWIERVDGTKVLTFPYKVGTATCLPHFDWKYHKGKNRP